MAMGKGMKMYLMAAERQGEQRRNKQQEGGRTYNLDGTYNVQVGGGGNRGEGGSVRTGGSRIGDPRSEYGGEMNEARYRGRDGRYHAGRRRSEYEGGETMRMGGYAGNRMGKDGGDEEEETYEVTIAPKDNILPMVWPYAPRNEGGEERYSNYGNSDNRTDRQIGFGARMNMGEEQYKQSHMHKGGARGMEEMEFDEQTAREWVDSMESNDRNHPKGGKWQPEQLKELAKKHGVPTSGTEWWEFYAMVNAMYADYSEVAKRYNITSPDFYALMALAFINDKDAVGNKVLKYREYIAK